MSYKIIIGKFHPSTGAEVYEGKNGAETTSMDKALKFQNTIEAQYYFEKVHGKKNCLVTDYAPTINIPQHMLKEKVMY